MTDFLKKQDDINIIDIRSNSKYNDNHISNARNIPFNSLITEPNKYLNKNEIYYIYCQKGMQSLNAVMILSRQGYNVVNVVGGYETWILEGK